MQLFFFQIAIGLFWRAAAEIRLPLGKCPTESCKNFHRFADISKWEKVAKNIFCCVFSMQCYNHEGPLSNVQYANRCQSTMGEVVYWRWEKKSEYWKTISICSKIDQKIRRRKKKHFFLGGPIHLQSATCFTFLFLHLHLLIEIWSHFQVS